MISIYSIVLNIILSFLWLIKLIKSVFFHVYLWQLKEYRLDRYLDYLRTAEAKRIYLSKKVLIKIILCFSSFLALFIVFYSNLFSLFVLLIFIWDSYSISRELKKRGFLRPQLTLKSCLILLTSLFCFLSATIFFAYLTLIKSTIYFALLLLLFDLFLPFGIFLIFIIINPITNLRKKQIISQAKNKILSCKNLIVIGITGSYGKSSTKEILAQILSTKFKVLKTPKNTNTEIGVAKIILKELKPEHEVFVVEMGAYKIGEIKAICDLVKPQTGILTAIIEQHLALFGSLENIISAKFELIENLSANGTAILNLDNQNILENSTKYKINKLFYSIIKSADIYAENIIVSPQNLKFNLVLGKEKIAIESQLLGKHNVSNLLASAAAAIKLKMSLDEISQAISFIKPIDKTLNLVKGLNNSILIDDTYNANPEGIISALEYLDVYKEKNKILIFSAMYELGAKAVEAHQRIAKIMAQTCDQVYIINPNFAEILKKSMIAEGLDSKKIIIEENKSKIVNILTNSINSDSVILFEGRGPEKILEKLKYV